MAKVSIIGIGTVGAATGHLLALRDVADELVYVGSPNNQDVALGQAADTSHGVAYASNTRVRHGTYEDTADSAVVVITAGVPDLSEQTWLEKARSNAKLVAGIRASVDEYTDDYVSITTSNPVDLVNRSLYESGARPRERVIGFGGFVDSARLRCILAERFHVPVRNVQATVLGGHNDAHVPVFSKVRVEGDDPAFTAEEREELRKEPLIRAGEVFGIKNATEWGPATGVARMVESIVRDTGEVLPASVVLDGEYGLKDVGMGVPVRLGSNGVERVVEWDLSKAEQDDLRAAASGLADQYAEIA